MLGKTKNLTSSRVPAKGSGWNEAIPKLGDCFTLSHKSYAGARKDVSYLYVTSFPKYFSYYM